MKYSRCKCGAWERWDSGIPPCPCQECYKCHTIPANSTAGNIAAIPHEFVASMVETDEGSKPLSRCRWCFKTKAQVAKDQKP